MAKDIIYGEEARKALQAGIDKLAFYFISSIKKCHFLIIYILVIECDCF